MEFPRVGPTPTWWRRPKNMDSHINDDGNVAVSPAPTLGSAASQPADYVVCSPNRAAARPGADPGDLLIRAIGVYVSPVFLTRQT